MRIVLSTPPAEGDTWGIGSFPTLGLLYLAGNVKRLPNVRLTVVDPYAEGLSVDQSVEKILSISPDMLGVTVTSQNIRRARKLLSRIKDARPDIVTICGGHHATLFDRLLLNEIEDIDLILRGEAEESFHELCRRLLQGEDVAGIPGLSYRSGASVISGEPQIIQDINSINFPDRSVLDYDRYYTRYSGFVLPRVPKSATMISSRGCPYRCTFCAKAPPWSNRWRPRSARNVFEEMLQLSEDGYQFIHFVDENLTRSVARVHKLCNLILEHNLHRRMRFAFQGSVHDLQQETLDLMHRAGFDFAFVGVETGSEDQLARYRKPGKLNGLIKGVKAAKKAHMIVVASFITGAPGETLEDHEASKRFVRKTRPHICETGPLIVNPGSQMWTDMIGVDEPRTVEESISRPIYTFPDQPDKEEIDARIQDFRRAFSRSWMDPRRIGDVIDLMFHSPSLRYILKAFVKDPILLYQLVKRGDSPIEIVVK